MLYSQSEFNRRVSPAFLGLQQAVRSGHIGEIVHIEGQHSGPTGYRLKAGNWRATREQAPAGGMTGPGYSYSRRDDRYRGAS